MESMKPVYKSSRSALKRLRKLKPFKLLKRHQDLQHIFLNFSLRSQSFSALLCDSDQEFLSCSYSNLELDVVFKPKNKLVLRTFIQKILVEDMTQFTLFPKVCISNFTEKFFKLICVCTRSCLLRMVMLWT